MIPFIEKRLNDLSPKQADKKLPQAAVLILITDNENDYSIIFTERSKKLPSHAGEVAFPGGKKEDEDRNLIETVLRETYEEIGVKKDNIKIIGSLTPLYVPISNFEIVFSNSTPKLVAVQYGIRQFTPWTD